MLRQESLSPHISVMLNEVMDYLSPKEGEVYVDCTFGAGGYTKSILDKANCTVISIDMDPEALEHARRLEESIKTNHKKKFIFVQDNFSEIENIVKNLGYEFIDGIVLDLGVSSMQLDTVSRGFSFMNEALLDMRMSQSGKSAHDIVNTYSEKDLADIIYKYGDEHKSRQIAKKIVEHRAYNEIGTTTQLADIVRSVVGNRGKIDPATKTFQAIRICVNNELQNLEQVLDASELLLRDKGRLVVVSFHSLEDKLVKKFVQERSGVKTNTSRYLPDLDDSPSEIKFKNLTKKAVMCSDQEKNQNVRARSARLRAAVRVSG
ncbi:MAG: 16S rRNA (cytosine(1402)-N(4))-methyltransferase RsmH [Rickettsiales bacterium]